MTFGLAWQDAELLSDNRNSSSQSFDWVNQNGNTTCTVLGMDIFGPVVACETQFVTYELVAGWTFDSRNRAIFANRGSRHNFVFSTTFPGSEVEYYTTRYDYRQYWPIRGQWVFLLNTEVAFAEDLNDTTAPPPF